MKPGRFKGFSLVELLVVIGIIALLIGILMPVINRARGAAQQTKTLAGMREMMLAYIAYSNDNQGRLLLGVPPPYLNGQTLRVTLPTGQTLPTPGSGPYGNMSEPVKRYPARLAPYQQNVWRIMYNHTDPTAIPTETDSINDAAYKVYVLSLYPTFGLNSVFLGGDEAQSGFTGILPNQRPNSGKHVAFRITDVRRSTEQIVFIEVQEHSATGPTGRGYFRALPPVAGGRMWKAGLEKCEAVGGVQFGMPHSRWSKRIVTGFLDGHAAELTPAEVDDMRLWSPQATTVDYDYTLGS